MIKTTSIFILTFMVGVFWLFIFCCDEGDPCKKTTAISSSSTSSTTNSNSSTDETCPNSPVELPLGCWFGNRKLTKPFELPEISMALVVLEGGKIGSSSTVFLSDGQQSYSGSGCMLEGDKSGEWITQFNEGSEDYVATLSYGDSENILEGIYITDGVEGGEGTITLERTDCPE